MKKLAKALKKNKSLEGATGEPNSETAMAVLHEAAMRGDMDEAMRMSEDATNMRAMEDMKKTEKFKRMLLKEMRKGK